MRSQVTRHVSRRLLVSQVSRNSITTSLPFRPSLYTHSDSRRLIRCPQRRSFMGLFRKPPRVLKEVELEPGYETLLKSRAAVLDSIRPPPPAELLEAWREFFAFKNRHRRGLNSVQATCASIVLGQLNRSQESERYHLHTDDLRLARECLSIPPRYDLSQHVELAKTLYQEIRRKVLGIEAESAEEIQREVESRTTEGRGMAKDFYMLISALSQYERATEARDLLLRHYQKLKELDRDTNRSTQIWVPVLRGLAREDNEAALLETFEIAKNAGLAMDPTVHGIMTGFFAERDNVTETKLWFDRPIANDLPPSPTTFYTVAKFAIRNNQTQWASNIYRDLIARLENGSLRGNKACWDTSLQWAILLLDKGIDHIEHMIKVALEQNQDQPGSQPDIKTMNRLVRVAIDKDDPYLAERLISLTKELGFELNSQTYMLQLEYRIRANDMDGAFKAYQALQDCEEDTRGNEYPVLNEFIRVLCSLPHPDHDRILDITSYLEQHRVILHPQTVASLCIAFLKNDETYEVIDTLSLHTMHYSIYERQLVRKALADYCADKKISTARAWDAYALLRQFFPEVETDYRVQIMDAFFDRKRADMASHVFGHMRSHSNILNRPTLDVYVRFFEGIGRCPDIESLQMVHNMLKMDTTIEPNTRLYNALMIAYTACDRSDRALEFWKEITTSSEGPSYASLEAVFRAHQFNPFGARAAVRVWEKIIKMEIEVPDHVYSAYVACMAAHARMDDVKRLLVEMEDVVGKRPNLHTLCYVYNALLNSYLQDQFETWVKHEFPRTWEAVVQKVKKRRDEDGLLKFKLAQPWKA
ncbi:complex I intermediate-associated protein [Xylariomycetidae sp. FL2044]|nr:complex I intermediate-associated protein [Xylariomycetidae sp. FL2044]